MLRWGVSRSKSSQSGNLNEILSPEPLRSSRYVYAVQIAQRRIVSPPPAKFPTSVTSAAGYRGTSSAPTLNKLTRILPGSCIYNSVKQQIKSCTRSSLRTPLALFLLP